MEVDSWRWELAYDIAYFQYRANPMMFDMLKGETFSQSLNRLAMSRYDALEKEPFGLLKSIRTADLRNRSHLDKDRRLLIAKFEKFLNKRMQRK